MEINRPIFSNHFPQRRLLFLLNSLMTTMSHLRLCLLSTLLLFCVFASSFLTVDALVVGLGACRSDQIQALMEFKNEFDSRGCNHTDFVNGVRCNNATGAVKKLQLPSGCLRGTLKSNSSLFKLHHLRYLNLSENAFVPSTLPSGFGNLNKLEVLSLFSNGFVGQVPSSFGNLSQLSSLDLSFNEFTGSLAQVGNLSKLTDLYLEDNLFSEVLDPNNSLFRLHNLRHLNLAHNEFTSSSFFSGFENLNKLEMLSLSFNSFAGQIPSSISNLSQLSSLTFDYNELTGHFPLVQNLTKLSDFQLSYNNFSGTIPPSLFTMPSLSYLDVSGNHFSGPIEIPTNSSFSSSLEGLVLGDNHFDAQILEPISKLITLKELDLSFLNISYPVDLRILSPLKSLLKLDLSNNNLSASSLSSDADIPMNLESLNLGKCRIQEFPKSLKTLQGLKDVGLSYNKIKGKVPEWLWNLPRLTTVDLSGNLFSGFEGSPQVLMNSSLQLLDLAINHFHGAIPNLPLSINVFSAAYNDFTGNIPHSVCLRNSLKILDLSFNNITGSIPQCLSNLMIVGLRKNNLVGSIPDVFYVGSLLRSLDVGYNRLTGKLPRSLVNCSSLKFLSVENNRIKDTFPFWLKTSTELHVLILRSNRFFGQISPPDQGPLGFPELQILEISDNDFTGNLTASYFENWKAPSLKRNEAGSLYLQEARIGLFFFTEIVDLVYKGLHMDNQQILTSYTAIDFSGNRIEGQIPESIGQLKTLIALNLSNNAFTGHIPLSLGNAKVLESLDLSRNQLSGSIPNGLGALSSLAYINVSHNQLTSEIPQGTQIVGQPKSSFEGNAGLCGLPLDQSCFGTSAPPTPHHIQEKEDEDEEVLNWKAVTIGYASGVLLGMALGKAFASYKPEWLVKRIGLSGLRNH